ncbi:hypothetical protein ACQKL5_08745 [Peribacillus sp. NPDC097675]|uniref:hypothetical protein n=1 Tax=Peribacillus sp. NPDC097675 TaxID=3390618 RepID=UPI003D07D137
MRSHWSSYVWRLLWLAGLFVLINSSFTLGLSIQKKVDESFIIDPLFWFDTLAPLVFGVYLSLLFMKGWTLKIHKPLFLCVTIPCLILSLYVPSVYTFSPNIEHLPNPFWLLSRDGFRIIPIVAGLTLFPSLLGAKRENIYGEW